MNFIDHRADIKNLLWRKYGRSSSGRRKDVGSRGLYIFSRDQLDVRFKVGMSSGVAGLYPRLDRQYRICYGYPNEFWLHYLVIVQTASDARYIEKEMLRVLKTVPNQTASNEWKILVNRQSLKEKLVSLLNNNPDNWANLVVFGRNGWKLFINAGESDIKVTDLNAPTDRAGRPTIRDNLPLEYTKEELRAIRVDSRGRTRASK